MLSHLPRVRVVVSVVVALAAAGALAGPAAASARPAASVLHLQARSSTGNSAPNSRLGSHVHYAVDKPLCGAPSEPGGYTCDALRRVPVAKGTKGAYAYTAPAYQRGPAGGLTPADLAKAYDYNPNADRRNQTVALVDWYDDPHALADLNRFDRHYKLPVETARSFRKVNQSGKAKDYPKASRASTGEIALDIETVRAVCHTCRILLVEASGPSDGQLGAAEDTAARLGATEISNSFGTLEHKPSSAMSAAFNHPGIVITAATGDSGWYGWDAVNDGYRSPGRATFPATDPRVVAVGGTTLNLTSSGTRSSETVWNNNLADDARGVRTGRSQGATGGGCSKYSTAALWQRKQPGYAATGCGGKRLAADISADGDPQTGLDVINTFAEKGLPNWLTVGGTSLSSPLVAAMYALAGGAHGSAYPAASLYLNSAHRSSALYDVTVGGNSFCGGATGASCSAATYTETNKWTHNPNSFGGGVTDCSFNRSASNKAASSPALRSECNAVAGFDGPSGLGTPKRLSLFDPTNPLVTVKHPAHKGIRRSAFLTAKAVERIAGLHPVRYVWSFGDGKSSSGSKPGVHHSWTKRGTYHLTLRVTDSSGQATVVRTVQKVG